MSVIIDGRQPRFTITTRTARIRIPSTAPPPCSGSMRSLKAGTSAMWKRLNKLTELHRFILCLGIGLTGCAGYHLGPTNGVRAGERSVQVNPFVNQTIEPRSEERR